MKSCKYDNCIVVSRFNENVDWLMKVIYKYAWIQKIIIYNKGIDDISSIIKNCKKIQIIKTINIGRESETYLRYIIDNYYNLPDYIWFIQADPFCHSPDFIELLSINSIECYVHQDFQSLTWRYDANLPKNIEADKRFYINNNRVINYYIDSTSQQTVEAHSFFDYMHAEKVNYLNNKTPNPYNNYLQYMCGESKIPLPKKIITYCWSACFFVRQNSIIKNKINTYIKLRQILLSEDNQGGLQGYILERLWHYIFTHTSYNNIAGIHKSINWNYSHLCLCWNSNLGYIKLYDKAYQVHHTTKNKTELSGHVMIYFKTDTQNFEIHYNSYIDFVPIAIFPCLNIETAKLFLKFQIKNYSKINYNYLNLFQNNIQNNIFTIFNFNNIMKNKQRIRFKELNYNKFKKKKYIDKKKYKELLYDILGGYSLKQQYISN